MEHVASSYLHIAHLRGGCDFSLESDVAFCEKGLEELTAHEVGELGERLACCFLAERGIELIDRNVRLREGELDILAYDAPAWVLCEVKTRIVRAGKEPPIPELAVSGRKIRTYSRMARTLRSGNGRMRLMRFDVLSVTIASEHSAYLRYLESAAELKERA